MPTIKFLRDILNFGDGLIRKIVCIQGHFIKSDLYSPEFRQHFKTDGAVGSLKHDTEGNFDFKIDGVSHVSWFRKKMDKFREAIGISKRQVQNKGRKL